MKTQKRFVEIVAKSALTGLAIAAIGLAMPAAQADAGHVHAVHYWPGITIVGRVIDTNSGAKTVIVRNRKGTYTVSNRRNQKVAVGDHVRVVGKWTGRRIVDADIDRI